MFIVIVRQKRDAMATVEAIDRDEMRKMKKKKNLETTHSVCERNAYSAPVQPYTHRAVMALYSNRGKKSTYSTEPIHTRGTYTPSHW